MYVLSRAFEADELRLDRLPEGILIEIFRLAGRRPRFLPNSVWSIDRQHDSIIPQHAAGYARIGRFAVGPATAALWTRVEVGYMPLIAGGGQFDTALGQAKDAALVRAIRAKASLGCFIRRVECGSSAEASAIADIVRTASALCVVVADVDGKIDALADALAEALSSRRLAMLELRMAYGWESQELDDTSSQRSQAIARLLRVARPVELRLSSVAEELCHVKNGFSWLLEAGADTERLAMEGMLDQYQLDEMGDAAAARVTGLEIGIGIRLDNWIVRLDRFVHLQRLDLDRVPLDDDLWPTLPPSLRALYLNHPAGVEHQGVADELGGLEHQLRDPAWLPLLDELEIHVDRYEDPSIPPNECLVGIAEEDIWDAFRTHCADRGAFLYLGLPT